MQYIYNLSKPTFELTLYTFMGSESAEYFQFLPPVLYNTVVIHFTYPQALIIEHNIDSIILSDQFRIRKIDLILPLFLL